MIENTLLHSILDIISEQIEWPWRVPQDDNKFDPLRGLLEINKWGILQKEKVDNTNEWAIWQWAMKKQGPFITTNKPRWNP
jgi:uncharacterized membrane-anchored protein